MTNPKLDSPNAEATPKTKLGGYEFYRSIGSPRYVVAPMVDQSELAWRMLSRAPLPPDMAGPSTTVTGSTGKKYTRHQGGAHLCYTPMINARSFAQSKAGAKGRDAQYNTSMGEEGSAEAVAGIEGGDAPVFVQFCANDPEILLTAAKKVEKHCDAVDINFGCPQGIARRGHYGSYLQDEWDLIKNLIGILHRNLSVPVTAKFRIHPSLERTLAYAKMMEAAGAQILTCHGRTREMKGQLTGLADWEIIRQVKQAVNIPVFANGNILYYEDVERCLEMTGCDGVMTAEGNLFNPSIFLPPSHPHMHPPSTLLAKRYLDIVESLKTPTGNSAIKSHIFRVLKPILDAQPDESFRAKIGKARTVEEYRAVVEELESLIKDEVAAAGPSWRAPPIDPATGYRTLPKWVAQPYIRTETIAINAAAASAESNAASAGNTSPLPAATDGNGITAPADGNVSTVSAIIEPDSVPTGLNTPIISTPRAETPTAGHNSSIPAEASSSKSAATAAISCFHPTCNHIAATRCPHRACLTHCRATQAVFASASLSSAPSTTAAGTDEGSIPPAPSSEHKPLTEAEAIHLAQSGRLNGQGCEAHEEKVRARAEREKEKNRGRTARVAAAKEKKRLNEEGMQRNKLKRQASQEAVEAGRVRPVPAAVVGQVAGLETEDGEEAMLNAGAA